MAVLEVEFVFSCSCFVSDVLSAIQKSRKNYEIGGYVSGNNVAKYLKLFILRMKVLFLSAVTVILWTVCILIPKIVFTMIEGFIFECIMILITIGLKKCCQCYRISIKRLWKYYPRFIC